MSSDNSTEKMAIKGWEELKKNPLFIPPFAFFFGIMFIVFIMPKLEYSDNTKVIIFITLVGALLCSVIWIYKSIGFQQDKSSIQDLLKLCKAKDKDLKDFYTALEDLYNMQKEGGALFAIDKKSKIEKISDCISCIAKRILEDNKFMREGKEVILYNIYEYIFHAEEGRCIKNLEVFENVSNAMFRNKSISLPQWADDKISKQILCKKTDVKISNARLDDWVYVNETRISAFFKKVDNLEDYRTENYKNDIFFNDKSLAKRMVGFEIMKYIYLGSKIKKDKYEKVSRILYIKKNIKKGSNDCYRRAVDYMMLKMWYFEHKYEVSETRIVWYSQKENKPKYPCQILWDNGNSFTEMPPTGKEDTHQLVLSKPNYDGNIERFSCAWKDGEQLKEAIQDQRVLELIERIENKNEEKAKELIETLDRTSNFEEIKKDSRVIMANKVVKRDKL